MELDIHFRSLSSIVSSKYVHTGCLNEIPHGLGLIYYLWSGISQSNLLFNHTQRQMGTISWLHLSRFSAIFSQQHRLDFTSQSNVCVFTQVASQICVHHNVVSPWVAGHIEHGPPSGDREHFISHWHVHLYPHHPAEGCWGLSSVEKWKRNSSSSRSQNNVKTTSATTEQSW